MLKVVNTKILLAILAGGQGPDRPHDGDVSGDDDLADFGVVVVELQVRSRQQSSEVRTEGVAGAVDGAWDDGDQIRREQVADAGGVVGIERGRPMLEAGSYGCAVRVRVGVC